MRRFGVEQPVTEPVVEPLELGHAGVGLARAAAEQQQSSRRGRSSAGASMSLSAPST